MVTVFLAKALLCFSGTCYPVLIGDRTPVGEYDLSLRYVAQQGYGGDVIQFYEDDTNVLAIHRVWLGRPTERRLERLASDDPEKRKGITKGCINVTPEVYAKLLECCTKAKLVIQ